jgi:hypothetical protein
MKIELFAIACMIALVSFNAVYAQNQTQNQTQTQTQEWVKLRFWS